MSAKENNDQTPSITLTMWVLLVLLYRNYAIHAFNKWKSDTLHSHVIGKVNALYTHCIIFILSDQLLFTLLNVYYRQIIYAYAQVTKQNPTICCIYSNYSNVHAVSHHSSMNEAQATYH